MKVQHLLVQPDIHIGIHMRSPHFTTGSRELQAVQRKARDLRRFADLLQTHWRGPQFPLHSAAGWSAIAGLGEEVKEQKWMMDDGYDIL